MRLFFMLLLANDCYPRAVINIHMLDPKVGKRNQVEAIVFRHNEDRSTSFLVLKRAPHRGGFWQPVTGKVEEGESFEMAARREVGEELGITEILKLVDTEFFYEFTDHGEDQFEYILGAQVKPDQEITLSAEHTEYAWVTLGDALNKYLKYPGNKEGMRRLASKLAVIV